LRSRFALAKLLPGMTGFDFAFALFSLVLGLALAENIGGFARAMRLAARARAGKAHGVRIGLLTPLLAVLVTMSQLSLWHQGYAVRNGLPFSYLTLLAIAAVVGTYYLFSSLVWPNDPAEWPDFDEHYDQHNRLILSGILAINVGVTIAIDPYAPPNTPEQIAIIEAGGLELAGYAMIAALLLTMALIFVKNRLLNVIGLTLVIACILTGAASIALNGLTPV
jgi:hypothetical protein